jgi:PDZ domain-containing protein
MPRVTPGRLAAAGIVLLVVFAGILAFAPSEDAYLFLPDDSAHAVAPLVTVEGEKPDGDGGGIFYVNVVVRQATLFEHLCDSVGTCRDHVLPRLHEGADLVPARSLNPTGLSEEERRRGNLREMSRSQQIAAAVALRELGYDVKATPVGVLVAVVQPGTPAAGRLQPTDVIVSLDRDQIRTVEELRESLAGKTPGDRVDVTVRRGDTLKRFRVGTFARPEAPKRAFMGVIVEQAADVELPIDVRIETGDVGGPSAGLAFALDVVDELGRNVDRGRKIAVTGELELDGGVAPVGGLKQKTIGARRSGVDVFVVPAGENAAEARRYAGDMRVVPVRTFQQALRTLSTGARNSQD